jgi:hypothetical protein
LTPATSPFPGAVPGGTPEDPGRWIASPAAEFAWADWSDGHVLHHRPSGKTHFLNEAGAALLREMLANPGEAFEADPALQELLLRFETLGLVERVRGR